MIRFKRLLCSALVALGVVAPAAAETYPARPVTMIVAYPPGGASDVIARVVAAKMSERLGQQVVVENRAGAGGNLGAKQAAQAKNDGYTILMGAITAHSIAQTLTPDTAKYSLEKDFAPVSMLGNVPVMLVVNPNVPAKSLKEFIELAKQKPGQLTLSSAGIGTTQHLAAEQFALMTRTKILHVPYKGSGPATVDLVGGQIDAMFDTSTSALAHIKGGRVRALAVAADQRLRELPGVPTFAEQGLKDFNVPAWYGFVAPTGTPAAAVQWLNAEVNAVLKDPAVVARLDAIGAIAVGGTPAQMGTFMKAQSDRWAKVINDAGIKLD